MEDEAEVRVDGFENFPKEELGTYDLVTTNVPFGDFAVYDPDYSNGKDPELRAAAKCIHRYYVLKGLDCLWDGGIEAYIITSNYLNHGGVQIAKALKESRLVGAYRLASNLFKENGTEVGTDLLVLLKDSAKKTSQLMRRSSLLPISTASARRTCISSCTPTISLLPVQRLVRTLTASPDSSIVTRKAWRVSVRICARY